MRFQKVNTSLMPILFLPVNGIIGFTIELSVMSTIGRIFLVLLDLTKTWYDIQKGFSKLNFNTMIDYSSHKIKGIIAEIKETQSMITLHKSGNDPLDPFMTLQFVGRKRKLFRELLAELVLSDLRFQDLKRFIDRLAAYLEAGEESISMPSEIQSNLAEVEGIVTWTNSFQPQLNNYQKKDQHSHSLLY